MAFHCDSSDVTRVNLSEQAYLAMENDLVIFCEDSGNKSNFLNRIFANFKSDAKASISVMLERERQKIYEYFNRQKKYSSDERKYATKCCIRYYGSIFEAGKTWDKGKSIRFKLNDKNFRYLTEDPDCGEDLYYRDGRKIPRISLYLKALYEEYAALPIYAREQIYFAEYFTIINEALKNGMQLRVKVASGKMYYVRPHRIVLDSYYYLTGISISAEEGDGLHRNAAFRIANVADVIVVKSRSGRLTKEQKSALDIEIRKKGAQFLTNDVSQIKVKLTPRGIQKYNSVLHLRPKYEEILSDGVYRFTCTERQIEYYFFRFGRDAIILEPESLAKRFAAMYNKAAVAYQHG